MEVLFRFHTRWGAPISGDNVRIAVELLDAEASSLWASGELSTNIYEPTDFLVSVPDVEGAAYLYVGVYDLEDATPVTVYRDGEAIAEFTGIWSDQWQEATVVLPAPPVPPPTLGDTMGSLIGAILPIMMLGMLMGIITPMVKER